MYVDFYRLTGRPFQLTPDPRFYFDSRSHKKAMAYLTYGLNQGEGFIIVTGDIGAGKSTLVAHLLGQLDTERIVAGKLVTTQIEADDTLRMVASAFGIPQENRDKATLLRAIEDFLMASHEAGRRVLLIVDEVQNLPPSSLEELRMLSNFQVAEKPVLQCYLLGQPQFLKTLASRDLEQLRQRVIASYHLGPLGAEETRGYIQHRLATVGWDDDPAFSQDAYRRIYDYTKGVPRRINTLCSRLLLFGFLDERHEFDGAVVDEVVKDLNAEVSHAIETGEAPDDQGEAAEAAAPTKAAGAATPAAYARALNGELAPLLKRIEVLERYVRAHDRTIKRALEIAARYLEGNEDEAAVDRRQ